MGADVVKRAKPLAERILRLSLLTGIFWTILISSLFLHGCFSIRERFFEMAKREAAAHFNMDWATRLWAASHGGVSRPPEESSL